MKFRAPVVSLLIIAASQLGAQDAPRRAVSGVVYDSIARAPLAGAVVQLVLADSAMQKFAAVADSVGRYRIERLPAGRYGIGFQHPALVALGLEPPLRAFQLFADSVLTVDLAVPSSAQVRALRCSDSASVASDGMLAGFVLDAARGTTLAGARVVLSWVEIASVRGKLQTVTRRVEANVGDDGTYAACGVAGGTALSLQVVGAGYRAIDGEITVPESATVRRDFRLADSAATSGRGVISGRVVHADGSPVTSGHVVIPALGFDAAIESGAYSIAGVPAGTWLVEARVLGFQPLSMLADAIDGSATILRIALGPKVQLLDAVSVVGKANRDVKTLTDMVERGRAAWGTQFLPGNSWLQTATFPADPLRAARGFTYYDDSTVAARGCDPRLGGATKRMVVYLDGMRFPGGLSQLREQVPMKEILAIEAYSDWMSIPGIWRTNDACAVIAFWTKR